MNIQGFQKLTLLDYPGHMACTVFTGGCNFRCPFCHNAILVTNVNDTTQYTQDEVFSLLEKRLGILDGVAITGGEPTLQPDLLDFMKCIKDMGFKVKLDTNGSRPDVLKQALDAGLCDYIAMDIKNSREKYAVTIGKTEYDTSVIEKSADLLMSGSIPFEFRTTVVANLHNEEDFVKIGEWLSGNEQYYLQNFVDSGNLISPGMSGCDKKTMNNILDILKKYIPAAEIRGI